MKAIRYLEGIFTEQSSDPYVQSRINTQRTICLPRAPYEEYKLRQVLNNLSDNRFCHIQVSILSHVIREIFLVVGQEQTRCYTVEFT